MQKITDLSKYRNKKMLMDEAEKLIDFIFEQAKQGTATHKVEQDIFSKLLTMGHQALGQFIVLQGDGDVGKHIKLSDGRTVKRLPKRQKRVYRSIFGLYNLERVVYGTREGQQVEFVPLDTISKQLYVHHNTVHRVLSQATGMTRKERTLRESIIDPYLPFT